MKDFNEMTDHEILMELIEEKRKNDKLKTIKYAIYGTVLFLFVVALLIYVPKILKIINVYNDFIKQFNDTNTKINDLIESFDPEITKQLAEFIEQIKKMLGGFGL